MTRAADLSDLLADTRSLAVMCHDNPDPDCLGSALALELLAARAGVETVHLYYAGDVSHQQNRTFVNLLDVDLRPYAESVPGDYHRLALVDSAVPGRNNPLPADAAVDVVIDHHQTTDLPDAAFVDVREDAGATATILAEYLQALDVEPDETVATGLLFAIHRETLGFVRHVSTAEYDAARFLHPHADPDLIVQLSTPPFSAATLTAMGKAILNRDARSSYLVSNVGRTTERDAIPQAADFLLRLEGVQTALVFGVIDDTVTLSARSVDARVDLGRFLQDVFGDVGSAGGHADMAGAQIPLGIFSDLVEDDELLSTVSRIIEQRVFDAANLDGSGS